MKNIAILVGLLIISRALISQDFDTQAGASCTFNANNPIMLNSFFNREEVLDATFIVSDEGGLCTGTLVNRPVSDGEVGYYFITANHCFDNANLEREYTFYFNYQSPNANTSNTPTPNRAAPREQSESHQHTNNEYIHSSKVRSVGHYTWGDFELYEILRPIPPHFNISYAGWTPSRFWVAFNSSTPALPTPPARVICFHHPRADVKKESGYGSLLWTETPIATGCYTVTAIIDAVFGWLWGNTVSTQVVCNYVDNPSLTILGTQIWGTGDYGSSGASIINEGNRAFGVCTIMPNVCGSGINNFGKFYSNYPQQNIKNALNPNNDWWTDQIGVGTRRVSCYENLNLNTRDAYYFAASHYQSNNHITIKAANDITTTEGNILRVFGPYTFPNGSGNTISGFQGADYSLEAGNSITLNPGVEVLRGATFSAAIQPCNAQRSAEKSGKEIMLEKVKSIILPQSLSFTFPEGTENVDLISDDSESFRANPNPTSGSFTLIGNQYVATTAHIIVTNLLGDVVFKGSEFELFNNWQYNINIENQPAGLYFVTLQGNDFRKTIKVIKQ